MHQSPEPTPLSPVSTLSACGTDWKDTIILDLSPIPTEEVGAILQLCPKLESIIARDCALNLKTLTENLRSELKSLILYRVSLNNGLLASPEDTPMTLDEDLAGALRQLTSLEELVAVGLQLGDVDYKFQTSDIRIEVPATVKRLQINDRYLYHGTSGHITPQLFAGLDCLIVDASAPEMIRTLPHYRASGFNARTLPFLLSLRELCLGPLLSRGVLSQADGADFARKLNRLEVLCIDASFPDVNGLLPQLLTSHPTLRILVIIGELATDAAEILMPPLDRNPKGSEPLPLLHVFIGGQIAKKIRFAKSTNDAMEIHPITLPMPAFLEQPEVAAIFKGSWIAEMITKGAKSNARLWFYNDFTAQSFLIH